MSEIIGISEDKSQPKKEKYVNEETKKISFHHQKAIEELLSAIAVCPMDIELKQILRMRIWGKNPVYFKPMSCASIAIDLKCKTIDVERWEEDALYNIKKFLDKSGIVEIGEKFVKENRINEFINPKKRIQI